MEKLIAVRNVTSKGIFILSYIVTFFNFTSVYHRQNYPHIKLTVSLTYSLYKCIYARKIYVCDCMYVYM